MRVWTHPREIANAEKLYIRFLSLSLSLSLDRQEYPLSDVGVSRLFFLFFFRERSTLSHFAPLREREKERERETLVSKRSMRVRGDDRDESQPLAPFLVAHGLCDPNALRFVHRLRTRVLSFNPIRRLWTVPTMKHGPWLSRTLSPSCPKRQNLCTHSQTVIRPSQRNCWTLERGHELSRRVRAYARFDIEYTYLKVSFPKSPGFRNATHGSFFSKLARGVFNTGRSSSRKSPKVSREERERPARRTTLTQD